jgi:hypothetical protein
MRIAALATPKQVPAKAEIIRPKAKETPMAEQAAPTALAVTEVQAPYGPTAAAIVRMGKEYDDIDVSHCIAEGFSEVQARDYISEQLFRKPGRAGNAIGWIGQASLKAMSARSAGIIQSLAPFSEAEHNRDLASMEWKVSDAGQELGQQPRACSSRD